MTSDPFLFVFFFSLSIPPIRSPLLLCLCTLSFIPATHSISDDPLSAKDPLSLAVATATVAVEKKALSVMDDTFEPWALKRPAILAKYTTNESKC